MTDELVEQATALAQAAGKHIGADVRQLGEVTPSGDRPQRDPAAQQLADRALAALREEVGLLERMRAEFATEKAYGAPAAPSPRLDAMAARLEGMSRFALQLGLITPAEARDVWTEARRSGLHDRPAQGQETQGQETQGQETQGQPTQGQPTPPPEVSAADTAHGPSDEGEH